MLKPWAQPSTLHSLGVVEHTHDLGSRVQSRESGVSGHQGQFVLHETVLQNKSQLRIQISGGMANRRGKRGDGAAIEGTSLHQALGAYVVVFPGYLDV